MSVQNKLLSGLCVAFVLLIAAPMVESIIEPDKAVSESEKRTLQTWPVFGDFESLQAYFASINTYVNDHFGFRQDLIEINNKIKYSLNESPSKRVIRGKGDWLFLKIHDPLMSDQGIPKSQVRANIIERKNHIKRTYEQLSQQGIAYQHIVAANKMSVYSGRLPSLYGLTDINASYDFFKRSLNDVSPNAVLHALEVLVSKTQNDLGFDLYFKNDTHWNNLGAYYVYQESIKRLQHSYPEIEFALKDHMFKSQVKISGDLAKFTGLGSQLRAKEPLTSHPRCTARANIKSVQKKLSLSVCSANDTTMVLIGDSFISGIYAYMSQSVGQLYMITQSTSVAERNLMIAEIKPDVVVEILVERSLARRLP